LLISSTASPMPPSVALPKAASEPVIDPYSPTRMVFPPPVATFPPEVFEPPGLHPKVVNGSTVSATIATTNGNVCRLKYIQMFSFQRQLEASCDYQRADCGHRRLSPTTRPRGAP